MTPAAERVRNLAMSLCPSRTDAARLLRDVAAELDRGPADAHLREAAEREAVRLRDLGFSVAGERLDVRTAAVAHLLGRASKTLRNWRADATGPAWHSDGAGIVSYSLLDVIHWRDEVSRLVPINPVAAVL